MRQSVDQHDLVRAEKTCCNCGLEKSAGLLLCWPCHHSQKHHNDGSYSKRVQNKINDLDRYLRHKSA